MNQIDVITISHFKATCLAVLDNVKRTGRPILVTRRGISIAIINPPPAPEKKKTWLGSFRSKGKISGDILAPIVPEDAWHVFDE